MLEDEELNSVSITHTTYRQLRGSLTVVRRAFRSYRRAWIKNETCLWLTRQVGSAAFLPCLSKIVCFGLGPFGLMDQQSVAQSHTQHAAVERVAKILKGKITCNILCYDQDLAYDDTDKEVLRSIGITPLNDPKVLGGR